MCRVSIVISTYNRAFLLPEAIQSVIKQTYRDYELIIIDDGSLDETASIIDQISDHRIRYYYQDNAGLAAARNAGLRRAQGTYVAFLDDDDLWLPDKLARQVQTFEKDRQIGWVTGGYRTIDGQGKSLGEFRPWLWQPQLDLQTWLTGCPTVPSAVMVRRDWIEKVGGFDEELSRHACGAEDWDLWLRLAYAGCPMAWAKEILCAYRLHASSMMHNARRQRQSMLLVLDKLYSRPDLLPEVSRQQDRVYSQAYLRGAARLYAAGQAEAAQADVRRAIQLDPGLLENRGELLFNRLAGWAGDPLVNDPAGYIRQVFEHLPPEASPLLPRKREALGLAAKTAFFQAYRNRDWQRVRGSLKQLLLYQPGSLADRGLWSVLLEMILGGQARKTIKRIFSKRHRTT